jgi:hypothetical protein
MHSELRVRICRTAVANATAGAYVATAMSETVGALIFVALVGSHGAMAAVSARLASRKKKPRR